MNHELRSHAAVVGPIRTYKARQGRLSRLTTDTFDRLGPRYLLDPQQSLDPSRDLAGARDVIIEIGSGFGEATVATASREPSTGIVAFDVHTRGVARLMQQLEAQDITNVRVVHSDAVAYLRERVEPESLAGALIFFPDPWPKAKHAKRRLVQAPFVELLASRLMFGATLACATDWQPYAREMLAVLEASESFSNTAESFAPRPTDRPLTRFESAGLAKGHEVYDLVFTRR